MVWEMEDEQVGAGWALFLSRAVPIVDVLLDLHEVRVLLDPG